MLNLRLLQAEPASEISIGGITGTGACLPERIVSNSEIAEFVDTSDDWVKKRVGISTRHIANSSETVTYLACRAAERAMDAANITAEDVDLLVLASITSDTSLPSCSAVVQRELGIKNAMSFDIQAACSGFLFALGIADGLQKTHAFNTALVIGSETLSRITDWSDRSTCVLFGDGAGAVVYQASRDSGVTRPGIIALDLHTDAELSNLIKRDKNPLPVSNSPLFEDKNPENKLNPYMQMEGKKVFRAAVNAMSSSCLKIIDEAGVAIEDVKLFIPHQSNQRMIEPVCEKIGLKNPDSLVLNISRIGNTSAASIPIALDEAARAGRIEKDDLILMTAVGSGITYGSLLIRW